MNHAQYMPLQCQWRQGYIGDSDVTNISNVTMLQFGRLNKFKKSSPNIFEAESTTFDSKNKLCYSDLWFDCSFILPISSCNLIFCGCSRYRRSICYLFFLELTLCYGFLICSRNESYFKLCLLYTSPSPRDRG